MTPASFLLAASTVLPALLMLAAVPHRGGRQAPAAWDRFRWLALAALAGTLASLGQQLVGTPPSAAT